MDHAIILEKIERIEEFFKSIGLKKVSDIPKDWDLDSSMRFESEEKNFIVRYKNEDRVLIYSKVYILGGIDLVMSGKMGVSVFETIRTDYDFKCKYEEGEFFKDQLRDWKINNFLSA